MLSAKQLDSVAMTRSDEPSSGPYAIDAVIEQLQILAARLQSHEQRSQQRTEALQDSLGIALRALELIHDDDPGTRRQLQDARNLAAYEESFAIDNPLVSVVIPTWNRVETLVERAIPSALRQTHENLEVIVIGDASPSDVGQAIAQLNDSRIRYHNLTIRGPYPDDRYKSWLASGTPGINAGVKMARGQWIAPLGDDDAFVPDHIERLLAKARKERLEFVYGFIRPMVATASQEPMGGFPPSYGQIGLQAAIYHAGLRFMELELGHALFDTPNDWGLVNRMMRVGVRMGMIDDITVQYWPSMRNYPTPSEEAPTDTSGDPEQRATELAIASSHLRDRVDDLEQQLSAAQERSALLDTYANELAQRLEEVRRSRSWRLTAPLRRARSSM
jgi:chaperonin cofactor prefoldin